MRHLVIVARDRPDVFESLIHRFAGDGDVDVLLDRRATHEHVISRPAVLVEDRRQHLEDVDARLWVEGYVIVRLA